MASQTQPPEPITPQQIASATDALGCALAALEPGGQITVAIVSAAFVAVKIMREAGPPGHLPTAASQECERAFAAYHAALEGWNRQLPRIQGWLLTEKARLENRLGHAGAVRTWLDSNRQTR